MKSLLLLTSFLTMFMVSDYVGKWSYDIQGPDGNAYKGDLVIKMEKGQYVGELLSDGLSIPLKDLEIEADEISFMISVQGYAIGFNGEFQGNTLKATGDIDGMEFPFEASRAIE